MAPSKSLVWKHFIKQNNSTASCKLCMQCIRTSGNTTNLKTHLMRKHGDIIFVNDSDPDDPLPIDVDSPSPTSSRSRSPRNETETRRMVRPGVHKKLDGFVTRDIESTRTLSSVSRDLTLLLSPSAASMSTMSTSSASMSTMSTSATSLSTALNNKELDLCPTLVTPPNVKTKISQVGIGTAIGNIRSYAEGGTKHTAITNAILYMICKDNEPISISEHSGFQKVMKAACPLYKLPKRTKITEMIEGKYEVLHRSIKNKLAVMANLTLTTDAWTETYNSKSYLGITAHFLNGTNLDSATLGVFQLTESHTHIHLGKTLVEACGSWNIDCENVVAIVTDNAANIVKAVQESFGKTKHLPCFAHTLNLVPTKATENTDNLTNLIARVKEIVTYCKHNGNAADALRKLQTDRGVKEGDVLKLKQEICTRWNSTYYMLQRFIILKEDVSTVLLKFPKAPDMLRGDDLRVVDEIILLLQPIEKSMRDLCGEKYVTSSKVIPIIRCLCFEISRLTPDSIIASDLKDNLLKELEKRFSMVEQVHLLAIPMLLDPRYKRLHFESPAICAQTIQKVSTLMTEFRRGTIAVQEVLGLHETVEELDKEGDMWAYHRSLVKKAALVNQDDVSMTGGMPSELKQFLNISVTDLESDPIAYWMSVKDHFPYLYKVALKYIPVVATSVPSERLFSKAGNVITQKRNRLTGKRLSKLLFLNSLSEAEWNT